jgi:hypothetical protein
MNKRTNYSVFKYIATFFCLVTFQVPLQGIQIENNPLKNYVSYSFSGGRFGDNLMAYLHAKWISYKNEVPLLYKPFPFSSHLALHDLELTYSDSYTRGYRQVNLLSQKDPLHLPNSSSKLYICPYFPECQWERENLSGPNKIAWSYFNVDWKDLGFRQMLKELVRPNQNCQLVIPPKETINIAIHVREGGSYDHGDFALHYLTKFPTLDFYIEGLQKIIELFPQKSFYCYLFTDAENPQELIEKIRAHIPTKAAILFDCHSDSNTHNQNVLEDFFSFFNFDAFIHPQSNFSVIPSLIHDYAVVYTPLSGYRNGNFTKITKVKFEINESICQALLK